MGRDKRSEGAQPTDPGTDILVTVPSVGDGYFPDLIITEWLAGDGEYIVKNAPLFTVSTDKLDYELPSPASGVLEIVADVNTSVQIGEIIAIIHMNLSDSSQTTT